MNRCMKRIIRLLLVAMITFVLLLPFKTDVSAASDSEIGLLTIFASSDGGSSSLNTSGHAFISFENTSSSFVLVGALNVTPGTEITFGTWGNKAQHKGIWYNLESYFFNSINAYDNRVSLTMPVTQNDIDIINNVIKSSDTWSVTKNCSTFAAKIWNAVSSTTLSAGFPNTPTALKSSIEEKVASETARPISNTIPIGYVSNGSFVSVILQSNNRMMNSSPIATRSTVGTVKIEKFINMNPNSYGK